jgi:hypothetical protein
MSSAPDVRQVRAALFLSIALGLVGIWGVNNASGTLELTSRRPDAPIATGDRAVDATLVLYHALQDVLLSSPYAAPIAGMNLFFSVLLIIGNGMVAARSKNAIWWVRNVTVANALYVIVETVHTITQVSWHLGALRPHFDAWMATNQGGTPAVGDPATSAFGALVVGTVILAVLRLGLMALFYWRVGTETIRAFLATAQTDPR